MLNLNKNELSEAKRALLEKLRRGDLSQSAKSVAAIPRRTQAGPAPLSFGQQQLWILTQLLPTNPVYNECVTIYIPGPLDANVFEKSFNEIIARHETWRTSFPLVDGQPVQMVHAPSLIPLPVTDLRHLPEAEREAEMLRLATRDAGVLFDLTRCPLMCAQLIRLHDEEHRLFITMHHIIFDAFSLYQILLPELRTIYEAFLAGRPSPLPPLPVQYTDYACWQRERVAAGQAFADQLAYWKKQLAGIPATLELPADYPRPAVQSYRGSTYPFALPKPLSDALKAMSRQQGVTLFITLVAAFQILLQASTGQDDIPIGTVTSGRKHPELQRLIGFFLNTLVLRADLSGNPTFSEVLKQVREVTTSAYANEDVPFEYVVKELQPGRSLSQNPLFQVLITIEPPLHTDPSGWTMTLMDVKMGRAKFDLTLELDDRPEGITGRFEYNTDLFGASTITRMVEHWQTLLERIVTNPAQRIAELSILTEAERQMLLVEWNNTTAAYPKDRCFQQLFEAQVARTPEAEALVFENRSLTYCELNRQANQLAHHLRNLGVGPETLVGLCIERSPAMVISLLGILKAGGAYVPLDPGLPSERLTFMLEDTQVPLLVTRDRLVKLLAGYPTTLVRMDADQDTIAREPESDPDSDVQPHNVAYVLYTSGSTGKPKGAMITHQGLVNYLSWATRTYRPEEGQGSPVHSPLSFDLTITSLFAPLLAGQRVILLSEEQKVEALPATLQSHHDLSLVKLTPSHLNLLGQYLSADDLAGHARALIIGGEALLAEQVNLWRTHAPATRIINEYGPTETVVGCCVYEVTADDPTSGTIPIGRPIANTQIYLLDAYLRPVPVGVPAELYIGGDGLARGYLNRPALTAERFIDNPFSSEPGARLYKTGDLARYRPDGVIEFLGRLDHQVKLHGYRIELGEIESVLSQHPAVREAIVTIQKTDAANEQLVAYVVFSENQLATADDLRNYLTRALPSYMLPSTFVPLAALPLTPNGKVDRQALPLPESAGTVLEESFAPPTELVHFQLVQIWEELLTARPIGIKNDFFDLGGHSLLAARMVDRIEQVSGVKIPLSTLFAEATIEHLAEVLQKQEVQDSRVSLVAVQPGGSRRPFFFFHGDWTGGAFYCLYLARHLGPDQPFYILEPYKYQELETIPTFEAMAAAHLSVLRSIQPEGPYLLGGYCNGGLVAYEIARQLGAEGQSLDLLVLMDPSSPEARWSQLRIVRGTVRLFCTLMRLPEDKQLDWFLRVRHIYRYIRFKHYRKAKPAFSSIETLRLDWTGTHDWIASAYTPTPYRGKITFFWNSEEAYRRDPWLKFIESAADKVETHIVPGSHITCRTEYLPDLAERLRESVQSTYDS